ncbi:hypothetical protein [Leifsonia sp. 71-9]|uniref:hypothetical protein n=1 Tax=Leifsonia sp. 71-9 TaxID=1895934 RepID=UPI00092719B5|nr:hypothetical protein [Leifsonia sp. 71-9]OJX75378.1 MAG: hypothetical protein BGO91_18965 [Leifsonia sp. 71-9]
MWNPPGKGYNTLDPDDAAEYFDDDLRARIGSLSPREMVELSSQFNRVTELVYEQLDNEFTREDEDEFSMQLPPVDLLFRDIDPEEGLFEGLTKQIEAAPLRWRLDLAQMVGSYVRDYGPSQRKYIRILKRIQRESRR